MWFLSLLLGAIVVGALGFALWYITYWIGYYGIRLTDWLFDEQHDPNNRTFLGYRTIGVITMGITLVGSTTIVAVGFLLIRLGENIISLFW